MRELIEILAWFCTGGLMASAALSTGSGAWAAFRARPMLFVRVLFAVWVAVPLIAMAVVWLFSFKGETRAAVVLLSISPGIPVLLAAARREGERALADGLVFLALTALTVPFLLPIWARLLEAVYALPLIASPLELSGILIPTVYAPLGLGLLVHRRWPRFAKKLARFLEIVANDRHGHRGDRHHCAGLPGAPEPEARRRDCRAAAGLAAGACRLARGPALPRCAQALHARGSDGKPGAGARPRCDDFPNRASRRGRRGGPRRSGRVSAPASSGALPHAPATLTPSRTIVGVSVDA
ncbi:MAG: hypothetical protein HOV80_31170 [Polyangiaceae bacterium]|nr:hypothetical protein [Polyangiaceae bacterium]